MSGFRLSGGGLIDRRRRITFSFDGRAYDGFAGDTLASALLANGVTLMGRSFKYHRPRGVLTAGPEEPNALVELGSGARREPNTRATTAELFNGLEARSQNRWPTLGFDLLSANGLIAPFLAAGFYYKTFMWPAAFWERVYEPLIRRAAGLGRLSGAADPDRYDKAHAFCDVLVIGGGRSGLTAARDAARAGERVILCEEDFRLGGRLLSGEEADPGWLEAVEAELKASPKVRILTRTSLFGVYDGGVHGALQRLGDHRPAPGGPRQRLWKIAARRSVLAAGAVERPLVFAGNDLPGVMLAGAVRTYLNRFATAPGRRAVVVAADEEGFACARDLKTAGVEVRALVDVRGQGGQIVRALGDRSLRAVEIDGADGRRRIDCDLLAVAGGWTPQIGLASHHGGRSVWSEEVGAFVAGACPPGMTVVGRAAGAGLAAPAPTRRFAGGKAFVDFQNDVTDKDVALAAREGFRSVEHLKRYTTLGMATDQGKTSNLNGLALLAQATGRTIAETGVTLARPPHTPVAIAAFAGAHSGKHFRPTRLPAGHDWAKAHGAVFVEAGQWLRPQMFPRPGETDWLQTVDREVTAVRTGVGVCDVSTLGKIEVVGADAGTFLDKVYINTVSTLAVGKARYGVMLREDGMVLDDGTAARLAQDRYVVSTTTANAVRVMQHLEYCRQVLWPELDVQMVSVTEQWSQYAVAGPRSRALLQGVLGEAIDLANAVFPYMAVAEFRYAGVTARLFRLSFSGELAFEIAAPAHHGAALLEALIAAGAPLGVTAYGTEALGAMRIEKGHVGGGELNGQTTAGDLGLGGMMSKKKDYVGRVLAGREGLVDPDRPALVGLKPVDRTQRLRAGAHFLASGAAAAAENDEGHLTSAAHSPTLGHWVGLGLLTRGRERHGEVIRAYDPVRGGDTPVEVCSPVFLDPEGRRLHD